MSISRISFRNLRFLVIAVAIIVLAAPLALQLFFSYMLVEGFIVYADVEIVYAYDRLTTGSDKVNLRFASSENIFLHVSRDYVSFLVPGGSGPYSFVNLKAYLPDMVAKKEYYKLHPTEFNRATPYLVPPENVFFMLSLLGAKPNESDSSIVSRTESYFLPGYTDKQANDVDGYMVYKSVPVSNEFGPTSLYVPRIETNNLYFLTCSGFNGADATCDIHFPYRNALDVVVTIDSRYVPEAGMVVTKSKAFLDSICIIQSQGNRL